MIQIRVETEKLRTRRSDLADYKPEMKLACSWCSLDLEDKDNEQKHYFRCEKHGTVFCDNCARNFERREIEVKLAPKCRVFKKINCVYKKVTNLSV